MKKISLLLLLFMLHFCATAQHDVTIGKYRKFQSTILGGEVTLLVHLPEGYENSDKKYPLLFLMNGHIMPTFANAASTLDNLSNERIPDMILVGISNTGVAGSYFPCPQDSGQSKAGENFYAFLKNELIPEIQKNYRTNNFRILAGQSASSLYVMYNFLFHPELFDAFIIASPMINQCPHLYLNTSREILVKRSGSHPAFYVSYGDLDYIEVLTRIGEFNAILKETSPDLHWKSDRIENCGHVPALTINNALLFLFSECTMTTERKKMSVPEIKTHFEKLSKEYGFPVYPKDGALFDRVVDLDNEKKSEAAIDLIKYLISLYPDSEVYYCYLGHLYQESGERTLAIENYNHALKINPDFTRAKTALKKLSE